MVERVGYPMPIPYDPLEGAPCCLKVGGIGREAADTRITRRGDGQKRMSTMCQCRKLFWPCVGSVLRQLGAEPSVNRCHQMPIAGLESQRGTKR